MPDCKPCHNLWRRILRTAKNQDVEEFIKNYKKNGESKQGALLFKDFRIFCDDDDLPRTRTARNFDFRHWAKNRLNMTDEQVNAVMPPQVLVPVADAAVVDDDVADVPDIAAGRPGTGDSAPDDPPRPADPLNPLHCIHVIVECECDAQVRLTIRNVRPRAA
jgi:hypothetical protein